MSARKSCNLRHSPTYHVQSPSVHPDGAGEVINDVVYYVLGAKELWFDIIYISDETLSADPLRPDATSAYLLETSCPVRMAFSKIDMIRRMTANIVWPVSDSHKLWSRKHRNPKFIPNFHSSYSVFPGQEYVLIDSTLEPASRAPVMGLMKQQAGLARRLRLIERCASDAGSESS